MPSPRAIRIGSAIVAALLWLNFLASLPDVHRVRLNDFPAYWNAGRVLLAGQPELLYSTQWKWYTNLPVVAVLFVPLGALEYEAAWELLWWTSVVCFAGTFALLVFAAKRFLPTARGTPLDAGRLAVIALVFFAFAPVMRRCLSLGQTTPLMVLLFGVVYVLARFDWQRTAGGLLGLICLVKIPPLLLIPLLALRGRLAMAGTAAAVVALGVLASFLFFDADLMRQYGDRVILDNFSRVHAAFNNQSLDGAFMRLLTDRGLADWVPVPRPPEERLAVYAVIVAMAALLLACGRTLLIPRARPRDYEPTSGSLELEIGLGAALMVLVFPIVWIHYYLFLVVPLCLLPFWWRERDVARGLLPGTRALAIVLFVLGAWLAAGQEVHENAWYAERETDTWVRLALNGRPLGALLLVVAFAPVLGEMARRQRQTTREEEETCGSGSPPLRERSP